MERKRQKGNFLKHEIINVNGQNYTFGDGTNGTILLGSTMEESLNNLAAALPATSFNVNGNTLAGSWNYNETSKKLTWSSTSALAVNEVITSDSIKTTADNDIDSLVYSANPVNIKNFDLFKTILNYQMTG